MRSNIPLGITGGRLVAALTLAFLAFQIISHAWVADDAYITFRVVDNLMHGYGLRWNVDERVQVYTHPLWMLLHIPFYAITGNIYLTTIGLSLACFALAVMISLRKSRRTPLEAAMFFLLPLAVVFPITDYAICGLENPLAMLLIAATARTAWTDAAGEERRPRWLLVSLLTSLLLLTRFDLSLLIVPLWAWLLLRHRRDLSPGRIALGLLPFVLWCGFCLFYYGFIFPNTKYAKLNTGLSASEMIAQGLYYVSDLRARDILSCLLLVIMIRDAVVGTVATLRRRYSPQQQCAAMLALGGTLYCFYVIGVGGDFMSGRFWSVPVFLALWLSLHSLPSSYVRSGPRAALWAACIAIIAVVSAYQYNNAWNAACRGQKSEEFCGFNGIIRERGFYLESSGLFTADTLLRTEPQNPDIATALLYRANPPDRPSTASKIGFIGYYAGPQNTIIDPLALTDPLLARLPLANGVWRIGHFPRDIPVGYSQTRATGDVATMDKALGDYYRKLRKVTSDPLWSAERLRLIIGFQRGAYDGLLRDYEMRHCTEYHHPCTGQK